MSAEAHILLSGHRLLIIVLQEYLGSVCNSVTRKLLCTVPIMWFVIQVCSRNLMVVHSFCTLQALRQPQGSRLLQPKMELDFAETLPI